MCFQVVLAYEVIVLCKCSGKYVDIYFKLKITFSIHWYRKVEISIVSLVLTIIGTDFNSLLHVLHMNILILDKT